MPTPTSPNRPDPKASESQQSEDQASEQRQAEDVEEQTHFENREDSFDRRIEQDLNQGFETGTEDVLYETDWGSVRTEKPKSKGAGNK
jgi:hypothetical protein